MNTSIEVVAIRPLPAAGNLKAFASVRLGDVTIHDCRVIQQPGQRAWVSMSQREYTTDDRERRFSVIVELTDALKKEVSRAVLAAWERGR
jgi:DNA-binding cell septation regulator SpoVG